MSQRYVWDKHNLIEEYTINKAALAFYESYDAAYNSENKRTEDTVYVAKTVSVVNGKIELNNPIKIPFFENTSTSYTELSFGSYSNTTIYPYIKMYARSNASSSGYFIHTADPGYNWNMSIDNYLNITFKVIKNYTQEGTIYKVTPGSPTYSKGSYIGLISNNNNIYPSNGRFGQHWYVYKGSDTIDPTAISYPSTIKGGQSITLTATKSSGINYGGTITYTYEVQLNGGSWTSIGDSTSLTKSYTVPAGTTTFAARVKAKDNMGFASTTYATGNQVTVINNTAPSTPSSISVPSSVQAGVAFTVSWGASTDSDGNLSGYTLQRSLNGGSYSTIYTGSSRSYQDTIPKSGYTSVTYRVQAYDTDGATSSYRTSSTATVINNVAPVISGSNQNLGVFTYNPPVISYVVTDENNDTVTVTVKLDSSTLDTRSVTLGQTYTIPINWWDINTGSHTVTIMADDGHGSTATRTYTFTKNSVGQISFNRLHKKTSSGYQITYIETDSDSIITNNGQVLSERVESIASRLSVSISTTPTEMVSRHRLHIKLTSEYTIDYLEMYSTNIKVGSSTLEEVLVRLETKVGINNGGTVPSNLNFERWRMKNSSGKYDIIYLEGVSEHIIRPCNKTVEESLAAIEAKL